MIRARRAYTVIEVAIAITIFSIVALVIYQLQSGAGRMGEKAEDVSDAMRSVMAATEFLRFDLGRTMVLDDETQVVVEDGGRKITMSISDKPDADLTKLPTVRMSYYVEQIPGTNGVFRLMRKTPQALNSVKDCYLTEFVAKYIPVGQLSHYQAYVEIAMVGVASPNAILENAQSGAKKPMETFISSQLIPLSIPQYPYPYALIPAGEEAPGGGGQ